jgi:hypothetical protein
VPEPKLELLEGQHPIDGLDVGYRPALVNKQSLAVVADVVQFLDGPRDRVGDGEDPIGEDRAPVGVGAGSDAEGLD